MPNRFKVLFGALLITLCACTPLQYAQYLAAIPVIGQEAADQIADAYNAEAAAATEGRPCAQWYDVAIEAGFTPDQWREPISRIMRRESGCDPTAVGPTNDWGLMQIHGPWTGALCDAGIACTRQELLDPATNLRAARYVQAVQGWRAWMTY